MERSPALLLCGLAALALAGCHQNGSLQVSWTFMDVTGIQSAADGCAQHGVDSVLVNSGDTGTDSDQVQALCAPGVVTRAVPAGTWTVTVLALDAQGNLIQSPQNPPKDPTTGSIPAAIVMNRQTGGLVVADDSPPVPVSFPLPTLPACMDGVDNDGDGRVDLDDPDCANNPYGTHE
jgi:hypothetical protein